MRRGDVISTYPKASYPGRLRKPVLDVRLELSSEKEDPIFFLKGRTVKCPLR